MCVCVCVCVQGLIALASSLNCKIEVEERRTDECRGIMARDQYAFESSSKRLAEVFVGGGVGG